MKKHIQDQKILVTVGSTHFDDLVRAMDNTTKKLGLKHVKAQIGNGKYKPKNMEWYRYNPNIRKDYEWADIIVCIDSAGTIFENLELGKKIIAVTPGRVLGVPDLAKKLSSEKYIVHIHETSPEIIEKKLENTLKDFPTLKKYEEPECTIPQEIEKLLRG